MNESFIDPGGTIHFKVPPIQEQGTGRLRKLGNGHNMWEENCEEKKVHPRHALYREQSGGAKKTPQKNPTLLTHIYQTCCC